jgi:uncharacterized RDD family membrane protein YckC
MPNSRTTTGLPPGVFAGATGPRLLAALVEVGPVWLLVGLALLFAFVLDGSVLVVVLCLVLALAWAILVWAQRAQRAAGPGMRLDSLQVVGLSDGRPLGWGRVLVRWLVFAGLTITVVGLVAMLVVLSRHPRRQGWHDLAANAVVIKERPLAPPRPKSVPARTGRPTVASAGSTTAAAKASDASATPTPARADMATKQTAASADSGRRIRSRHRLDRRRLDRHRPDRRRRARDRRVGGATGVGAAPRRRSGRRRRRTRPAGSQPAAAGG